MCAWCWSSVGIVVDLTFPDWLLFHVLTFQKTVSLARSLIHEVSTLKRLNVLLSAYVCVPRAGGEDAVGWRWATYLSKHHNVTVLTYSKGKVEKVNEYKHETNAEFVFVPVPAWMERLRSMGAIGSWLHYILWQRFAERTARQLHQATPFDLVHHVVYNQFRTPSFGFNLGLPFVFGPVGGAETIPTPLFQDLQGATRFKEGIRAAEVWLRRRLRATPKPNTAYVFSNPSTQRTAIDSRCHRHTYLMPAVYVDAVDLMGMDLAEAQDSLDQTPDRPLLLVMPGRMLDWKGPLLALRALARARGRGCNIRLRIVGEIVLAKQIQQLCQDLDLKESVEITSYMPRRELLKLLSQADALFYAAFRDSGAMVVAESYLLGKPAIILDIDSQFHIDSSFGIKAAIGKTYEETVENLADALQWAFDHRSKLPELGALGKATLSQTLSWNHKLKTMEAIYAELLGDVTSASTPNQVAADDPTAVLEPRAEAATSIQ